MQKSLEVLVAEHDRDVAEGLSDILDMAGHKVHRAFTADKAYELLRDYDFHVAFLNVKKPGLSNMECFAELRKIKPNARLILMSAHTIDQLTAQITDGGTVKVLSPPLTPEIVMETLVEIGATGTLLIEEAPADFGTALQSAFNERSVSLEIAQDETEAQAKAAAGSCDVLLLDLHLSVMRSLEIFLGLKQNGHAAPTIIFQSYADDGPSDSSALDTEIFFKPFDPAQMVKLLEEIAAAEDGISPPQAAGTPADNGGAPQPPAAAVAPDPADVAAAIPQPEAVPAQPSVEAPQTAPPALDSPLAGSPPAPAEDPAPEPPSPAPDPTGQDVPTAESVPAFAPEPSAEPVVPAVPDGIPDSVPAFAPGPSAAPAMPADPGDIPETVPAFAAEPSSAPAVPADPPGIPDNLPPVADDLPAQATSESPRVDAEPAPPPAEPVVPAFDVTAQQSEQVPAPAEPAPSPEAPPQAAEPAAAPNAFGTKNIWAEESPSETRLPAGVGISADQLERAVNEPASSEPTISQPVSSEPVSSEPVSSEPVSSEPASSEPVSSEPAPEESAPTGKDAAPVTGAQETRVLVVDDDFDMAEGLAEILEDCGLVVKVAHTSESAVAALDDFDAQITLLDIQLGKDSGLDLIPDLKQKCPNMIVVMVTAQTDQQSAIIALRNGAFDYLNKPLHPQELLAAMDRCFDEIAKRGPDAPEPSAATQDGNLEEAASEYMSKLSHKLRTPLNAVVGFSEILSEEMLGPLGSPQYLDYAHDIKEAGQSLVNVIDHFEDIDASESGKVEINEEEVDLSKIIFHCLKMIQPAVDAGHLTVEIELAEIPVFMVGDNHKLTQIMLSLLTNAVKFTPSQGKIRFTQRRDEAGGIVIEIVDTGVGIAEEIITEALSSVVEGDGGLDPEYQGSGLSLPLATSMAELHGGNLTLESEVGSGTIATLILPPERNIAPKHRAAV